MGGGGGYKTGGGGGTSEGLPYKKAWEEGWGAKQILAMLKGEHKKF